MDHVVSSSSPADNVLQETAPPNVIPIPVMDIPVEGAATRIPAWAYLLVTVGSMLIGATAIVRGTRALSSPTDSDLTDFFLKSADYILRGDPWRMYAARGFAPFQTYPNDNTPLHMFLLAPLLQLARAHGFAANTGALVTFVSLPFVLLAPLTGYMVVQALRTVRPDAPEPQRFVAFALFTLSPLLWLCYASWYHLEQPLQIYFLLAAVIALQSRREALAGVLAGLAVLSGVTAIFPLVALGALLALSKQWRAFGAFAGVGVACVGLGMAPFFLADRRDTLYSFVLWRGRAEFGGSSPWSVFTVVALPHTLDAVVRRLDTPAMLLWAVAVAFLAARRSRVSAYGPGAWAVVGIAALALPMLSKQIWPYYYLQPWALLLVWEFGTLHRRAGLWRWPILTGGYLTVAATLAQYTGFRSVGALDRVSVGLLEFGVMLLCAVVAWRRLRMSDDALATRPGATMAGATR